MSGTDRRLETHRSQPATLPPLWPRRRGVRSRPQTLHTAVGAVPTGEGVCIQHEPHDHLPCMTPHPPGHLHQLPADGRDGLGGPRGRTGEAVNADAQVVRQHANPEQDRMGPGIPTRHLLQPQAGCSCLIEVLRLAALIVPAQHLGGGLLLLCPLAGHDGLRVRLAGIHKQIALSPRFALDDQPKRGLRRRQGMHRFATPLSRCLPGLRGNPFNHRLDRHILIRRDRPGDRVRFPRIDQLRLVRGTVRSLPREPLACRHPRPTLPVECELPAPGDPWPSRNSSTRQSAVSNTHPSMGL